MTLCEQAIDRLSKHFSTSLLCSEPEGRFEVISTPFFYPDRDNVELFLSEPVEGLLLVSDQGQTVLKLAEYGFTPHTSGRRRAMIYEITSSLHVRYENGSLNVLVGLEQVGQRSWDLLLAIQRLSDLVFTVPGYTRATFPDEFENFIITRNIPYVRGVQIQLLPPPEVSRLGAPYRFTADFVVQNRKVVQLLSASSTGYARERLDRVYVNFAEMRLVDDDRQKVAVVDDNEELWSNLLPPLFHQADSILYWSNKRELETALRN